MYMCVCACVRVVLELGICVILKSRMLQIGNSKIVQSISRKSKYEPKRHLVEEYGNEMHIVEWHSLNGKFQNFQCGKIVIDRIVYNILKNINQTNKCQFHIYRV